MIFYDGLHKKLIVWSAGLHACVEPCLCIYCAKTLGFRQTAQECRNM